MAKLYTDLKVGETLPLDNGRINITLEHKKGRTARLRIESPHQLILGKREPLAKLPAPPRKKH